MSKGPIMGDIAETPEVVEEEEKDTKLTKEESKRIESIFFEDDEEVKLRDGVTYKIQPAALKNARRVVELVGMVNTDFVIANFLEEAAEDASDNLIELLSIAFENYEHVDEDYINEYVDLEIAAEVIDIVIGLNGIKKRMGS